MPESKYRNKLAAQAAQSAKVPPPQPYTQQREVESIASLQRAWQESIEYWDTRPTPSVGGVFLYASLARLDSTSRRGGLSLLQKKVVYALAF